MKGFVYSLITTLALIGAAFAIAGFSGARAQDVGMAKMAVAANDLPTFLHYHPTDGDTQGGKVRRALDLTHIR